MRDNLIIDAYSLAKGEWPIRCFQGAGDVPDFWAPARPEGFGSIWYRLRATWLVFIGRADALIWPYEPSSIPQ